MVNEKRIITMSHMALYSEGNKNKCMKVCSFYKKDYVSFQTIMTLLWVTLGYIMVVGASLFLRIDELTSTLSIELMIELTTLIIGCYILTLFAFGAIAVLFYTYKYTQSLEVAKKYYKALGMLNKDYKREK